jgi:hypothetical protein
MKAFLCRLPGLREIAGQAAHLAGSCNFSSLSHGLARASGVKFLRRLIERLQGPADYQRGEFVALDSMAVTFGKGRRHRCKDFNNRAAGGGVLWSYRIKARPGTCPVRLIELMRGAWNDAHLMRGVALEPDGPLYLMDRGFYCIDLISEWLASKVRFIVRVKAKWLRYDVLSQLSPPRRLNSGWRVGLDAMVHLGSPARKTPRPRVRLIIAYSPTGEQFIYATSESRSTAGQVIDAYKQRWHIERFHRFMKDNLGLAHLYSFDANGLEFLILSALLAAMLLFTNADPDSQRETISLLQIALSAARQQLQVPSVWRRNILAVKRRKGRPKPQCHSPTNL